MTEIKNHHIDLEIRKYIGCLIICQFNSDAGCCVHYYIHVGYTIPV